MIGAAMTSVGLFASTVTDKQVVAAVLSIGLLVIFWFVGGGIGAASQRVTDFLRNIALYTPFRNMFLGLLDLRDVFYFLSFTFFNLFVSHRVMEAERF
jgi:ABC-2 type transport system permease protein